MKCLCLRRHNGTECEALFWERQNEVNQRKQPQLSWNLGAAAESGPYRLPRRRLGTSEEHWGQFDEFRSGVRALVQSLTSCLCVSTAVNRSLHSELRFILTPALYDWALSKLPLPKIFLSSFRNPSDSFVQRASPLLPALLLQKD